MTSPAIKALQRLYRIVDAEMGEWYMPKGSQDELRDAMKEAKQVLYGKAVETHD